MKVMTFFENKPLLFREPAEVISCSSLDEVAGCFHKVQRRLDDGFFAAGFLSYEAGCAFEDKLFRDDTYDFPLVQFGIYDRHEVNPFDPERPASRCRIKDIRRNTSISDYSRKIGKIIELIENGEVYQITYCIKSFFKAEGLPYDLFRELFKIQPVPYSAFIDAGNFHVLSLSPELFLKKNGERIMSKPMKGTWSRQGLLNSILGGFRLKYDGKNRAENVMIADLLRNDLGRIGRDIRAPKLFEVARYRMLYQMTSTVTGIIDPKLPPYDIFKAVFPSGSVTGAPRIRAMEVIRDIEKEPRRIYTGAIGYITPDNDMFFNIPIRTVLMRNNECEMGIGGGIVWDSTADGEWEEGLLKAKFITELTEDQPE